MCGNFKDVVVVQNETRGFFETLQRNFYLYIIFLHIVFILPIQKTTLELFYDV